MSLITTLSVKDQHRLKYSSMRNYLHQKNMSMGDYLIQKWDEEFQDKIDKTLRN